jgi:hypothetical protein
MEVPQLLTEVPLTVKSFIVTITLLITSMILGFPVILGCSVAGALIIVDTGADPIKLIFFVYLIAQCMFQEEL